ncbi:beta-lactoglobulin-2-like [Orycteropus afer afer]|uniref:Beta-lactoglobulin-2-like n=1 Tax=Orycteropus afer afer TaxID=1230840 RepID=A0A8B7B385_ORYAF|nr:beta-lactoglobulin-2-like [Orycteropus afer afer]
MKYLLLTLGLALVCGIKAVDIAQTRKDLDIMKLTGTWHSMVMAASDLTLLETEKAPLRVYIKEMWPTPENNLKINLLKRVNGSCVEMTVIAQKTEDPAVFIVNYQGEMKVSVLDTDYDHYLFFCVETPMATEEPRKVCQYLARTLSADTKIVEKFDEALKTLPMHAQIVLDFSQGKGETLL